MFLHATKEQSYHFWFFVLLKPQTKFNTGTKVVHWSIHVIPTLTYALVNAHLELIDYKFEHANYLFVYSTTIDLKTIKLLL